MLVVKVGMSSEYNLVKKYIGQGVLLLSGQFTADQLDKAVPSTCTGIISTGLCGGLAKDVVVGQVIICDTLVTPGTGGAKYKPYTADVTWRKNLFAATRYWERHWWSSGAFNTANTIAQRDALCQATGCAVIDDETFAVAEFASRRGIAFQALRSISDGEADNLPDAVTDALNADGTTDIWAVIASVVKDPAEIPPLFHTAMEFKKSMDTLETALKQVGPYFRWYR